MLPTHPWEGTILVELCRFMSVYVSRGHHHPSSVPRSPLPQGPALSPSPGGEISRVGRDRAHAERQAPSASSTLFSLFKGDQTHTSEQLRLCPGKHASFLLSKGV